MYRLTHQIKKQDNPGQYLKINSLNLKLKKTYLSFNKLFNFSDAQMLNEISIIINV